VDLRLVEYAVYLAAGVGLTLWVGWATRRPGGSFLVPLVGLGGVALLLQLDGSVASAADVIRSIATRLGLVLLLLGGLHVVDLALARRRDRSVEAPAPAEYEPLRPASGGRFPY
jgi:hypothetical protein